MFDLQEYNDYEGKKIELIKDICKNIAEIAKEHGWQSKKIHELERSIREINPLIEKDIDEDYGGSSYDVNLHFSYENYADPIRYMYFRKFPLTEFDESIIKIVGGHLDSWKFLQIRQNIYPELDKPYSYGRGLVDFSYALLFESNNPFNEQNLRHKLEKDSDKPIDHYYSKEFSFELGLGDIGNELPSNVKKNYLFKEVRISPDSTLESYAEVVRNFNLLYIDLLFEDKKARIEEFEKEVVKRRESLEEAVKQRDGYLSKYF